MEKITSYVYDSVVQPSGYTIWTARSDIKSLHVIHKECLCNLTLDNHNINWLVFTLTAAFFLRFVSPCIIVQFK